MSTTLPTSAADALLAEARRVEDGASCVIATDTSGTILYWNERAAATFGWSEQEALTRNVMDVTPAMHSTAEAGRIMETLNSGRPWSGRFLLRHRDGTPMVMAVTDVPVRFEGAVVGIVGVSRRD